MIIRRQVLMTCLLLPVACGLSGCGKGRPATIAVKGTVSYKSEPVEGAAVMFQRDGSPPATGETDAQGVFSLTTFDKNDGAIPGEYVVTIAKVESAPEGSGEIGREPPKSSGKPPKSLIPAKYADRKISTLKETVTAGNPNEFTFELTD